jgi:hypothetical protein
MEEILADESKIHNIIRDELAVIRKKFSDDRKTQIETVSGEVDIEDLIPVEDCVVTYTNKGYIKRMTLDTYKTQHRGGRGVQGQRGDGDFAADHDAHLCVYPLYLSAVCTESVPVRQRGGGNRQKDGKSKIYHGGLFAGPFVGDRLHGLCQSAV